MSEALASESAKPSGKSVNSGKSVGKGSRSPAPDLAFADPFAPPYAGMRLPAEWEKQAAVWFTWPQNVDTWRPVRTQSEQAYMMAIKAALHHQDVFLLVDTAARQKELTRFFAPPFAHLPGRLTVLECRTNDSWIRDYGTLTVEAPGGPIASGNKGSRLLSLDFRFNSWGGKYPPWKQDDAVARFMAGYRSRECLSLDFVLEGGSLDVNGEGLFLTTRQCLLHENRNPRYDQGDIETILSNYLGVKDFLWLDGGIEGDDTDGHVDDLARFVDRRTIFCAIETDKRDVNYAQLKKNMDILDGYARRLDIEVVEIPMPLRLIRAGVHTPATYLNFLILNGAVIVPVFKDKLDDAVLQTFEKHFPGRQIRPIDCRSLVYGQGAIHCSSMQEPAEP